MKRSVRVVFVLSLAGNLLCGAAVVYAIHARGGVLYVAEKLRIIHRLQEKRYTKHHFARRSLFRELPAAVGKTVLLGDSFVEYGNWQELLGSIHVVNRGIGGDRTDSLLLRLDEAISPPPARLVVIAGSNDLHDGVPVDELYGNFVKIVRCLRDRAPQTELWIQSVLPVNNTLYGTEIDNKDVREINTRLKKLCAASRIGYLDLAARVSAPDGQLLETHTLDGQHLKGIGYVAWADALRSVVNADVNDGAHSP